MTSLNQVHWDLYNLLDKHIPVSTTKNGWTTCECGHKTRLSITNHMATILINAGYRKVA